MRHRAGNRHSPPAPAPVREPRTLQDRSPATPPPRKRERPPAPRRRRRRARGPRTAPRDSGTEPKIRRGGARTVPSRDPNATSRTHAPPPQAHAPPPHERGRRVLPLRTRASPTTPRAPRHGRVGHPDKGAPPQGSWTREASSTPQVPPPRNPTPPRARTRERQQCAARHPPGTSRPQARGGAARHPWRAPRGLRTRPQPTPLRSVRTRSSQERPPSLARHGPGARWRERAAIGRRSRAARPEARRAGARGRRRSACRWPGPERVAGTPPCAARGPLPGETGRSARPGSGPPRLVWKRVAGVR